LHGAEAGDGLREQAIPDEKPLEDLVVGTAVDGVRLVRSGRPGIAPSWFLTRSVTIVDQAVELADIVLFDTGPLPLTHEAETLIPNVDCTLLVTKGGRLTWDAAREAMKRLTRVRASVAGVVLVGGEGVRRYGYYESREQDELREQGGEPRRVWS
jgi:hypothetical protein